METLREKAISGAFWSAIQKFGLSIISFLSNIVLARLLTPDDYGCIGMLSIFIIISNALIYGGFISALIQKQETTDEDYHTVFIWNLAVSILLYLLLFVFSTSISSFYNDERLSIILRVQGIVLIINGLNAVQTTILRKNLLFDRLAKVNIIATIGSVIVAIIIAIIGGGVWALVIQQIVYSCINSILLWTKTNWHPCLCFSMSSFKGLFSYGCFLLLSDLMNSICDNIQGLIIGKKFSSSVMGYYSQAKKLEEVPTQSVSQMVAQVTFPIYAKIQDSKERLYNATKQTLLLMNYINIPMMCLLIVVARPLFIILYSEKWLSSVVYFQVLCLAGLVNCFQSVNYQVVSAVGRSKELFLWNFVKRGIGITLIIVGMRWGVIGILIGMVISFYFTYIINAVLAYRSTGYSVIVQVIDNLPIVLTAFFAGLASYLFVSFHIGVFPLFIIHVLVYCFVYLFISWLFKFNELFEMRAIIRGYINRILHDK